MRILTVRQPWALHIIQSGKDVENRVHNLAGDYRGPVAIHAALKPDQQALRDLPRKAPNGIPRVFEYGAIIGVVDLVDVHHATECTTERLVAEGNTASLVLGRCSEWAEPAVHHLELANPRKLARHIPYRGALGLRTLDPAVVSQIERGGYITHESRGATS
jgi:hypothetical protein